MRNIPFEVDEHYDLIKAIGIGAYGVVCSAIDLRVVPGTEFYDPDLVQREELGGCLVEPKDEEGLLIQFESPKFQEHSTARPEIDAPACCAVDTLRYSSYKRPKLSNGVRSPYVAIKKVPKLFNDLVDGKRVLREMKIMQLLRGHDNIVRMHELLKPRQPTDAFRDLYTVMELVDTDLHLVLKSRQPLEETHLLYIVYQLLKALAYCHSTGVVHRDLKPSNMLLTGDCDLKLADFGLSRGNVRMGIVDKGFTLSPATQGLLAKPDQETRLKPPSPGNTAKGEEKQEQPPSSGPGGLYRSPGNAELDLTNYVITRYYRPPELLIMSHYGHAVDIWSTGCIFAEIVLRKPLFQGRDYLSQLTMVTHCRELPGLPKKPEDVDAMFHGGSAEGRAFVKDLLFGRRRQAGASPLQSSLAPRGSQGPGLANARRSAALDAMRKKFFGESLPFPVSDAAMDFLAGCLSYDPKERPTALQLMRHAVFREIYSPMDEITRDETVKLSRTNRRVRHPDAAMGAPRRSESSTIPREASRRPTMPPDDGEPRSDEPEEGVPLNKTRRPKAVYYESEEESVEAMFSFDRKELDESSLRALFWEEIEKYDRRRTRHQRAREQHAVSASSGDSTAPTSATAVAAAAEGGE